MDLRPARPADRADVVAFTEDTWPEREVGDYVPDAFPEWVDAEADGTDGEGETDAAGDNRTRTLVADDGEAVRGVVRAVQLTDREAWLHGLRVDPEVRRRGLGGRLMTAGFDWARERGASVCRGIIFSWNTPSFALSRSVGFDPVAEFRWGEVDADPDADPDLPVTADPDGGWAFWTASDARDRLRGLGLSPEETWAVAELRPRHFRAAADDDRLVTVQKEGTRAASFRVRTREREVSEGDDEDHDGNDDHDPATETWAEYAVGAWSDLPAAQSLYRGIARDAAAAGADRARVLVPETARFVTDTAVAGADLSEQPAFVMAADLTDPQVAGGE